MKQKQRLENFRNKAITCLELTKGFTPEQRDNRINAIDDLAGDVQELVNLIPQILIDFKQWYDKLSPAQKCTVWPPDGEGGTGLYNMPDEDLIDKFLSRKPEAV
jgi:hypothetical protein